VRRLHGFGQRDHERRRLVGRLRRARQGLRQAAPFEELHREIRAPLVLAHIIDRHDVRVVQARHCLRFALEPRPLARACVCPGEQHFESHDAV